MARSFIRANADYIDVGAIAGGAAANFSFFCWVYLTAWPPTAEYACLFSTTSASIRFFVKVTQEMVLYASNFKSISSLSADPWPPGGSSVHLPSLNAWHHVGFTSDSTTATLYINGASAGTAQSVTGTGSPPSITDARICYDLAASGRAIDGSMADAAIWDATLTLIEIAALAKGMRPPQIRPASLKGYWPLAGLQSPEPDLSGSKNNGTLTGTQAAFDPPLSLATPVRKMQDNLIVVIPVIPPLMGQICL
jgi:hypothetical protein